MLKPKESMRNWRNERNRKPETPSSVALRAVPDASGIVRYSNSLSM